jgi:hypothetical protein
VTDDRFDDYVDEESISDFEAQDELQHDTEHRTDAERGLESAIDEPGTWALPDTTGVSSVDAAMAELGRLDELPTSEHVAVYEGLHRQLQDALADLDGS